MQELVKGQKALGYFLSPLGAENYPWGLYVDFENSPNYIETIGHEYGHAFLRMAGKDPYEFLSGYLDTHKIVDLMSIATSQDMGFRIVDGAWVRFIDDPDSFVGLQSGLYEYELFRSDPSFYKNVREKALLLETEIPGGANNDSRVVYRLCETVMPSFASVLKNSKPSKPQPIKN